MDHLKLKVHKHYCPYFSKWLTTGDEVQVRHTCRVTFAIGENYIDTVWCDMLPMDSGDILLVIHGCTIKMEFMACATTHTRSCTMESHTPSKEVKTTKEKIKI